MDIFCVLLPCRHSRQPTSDPAPILFTHHT